MKKGWQTKMLGDLCTLENGDRGENYPSKSVQTTSGVPFINAGHLSESGIDFSAMNYIPRERFNLLGNGKICKHDILFCLRGSLGKFASVGDLSEGAIASSLVIIRPGDAILKEFVIAYLQSDLCAAMIQKFRNGAAQPNLAAASLKKFIVPFPPLAEQKRIVGLLDEAFAGIATAQANAEKNLQNTRALFESHLQSVFTQRGPGWVETTIGDVCTLKSGTTVSPALEKPIGDIPYLKVADLTFEGNEGQITTSSRFLRDSDVRAGAIIPKGATIFPKRGGAILTNKKRITSLPICADLNIMAVIPSSQIDAGLLYFYFLNVDMGKLGTGSSIPQINNYDIAPLRISFAKSLITQAQIVTRLNRLLEDTQRLATIYGQKLAALEALKKSLLHQAFTGQL
jgi:type I restriction enzyme S subunit